jgi:hypothetical protein
MGQEDRAQAVTLQPVGDRERDLRLRRGVRHVERVPDDGLVPATGRHQAVSLDVVDVRGAVDEWLDVGCGREESKRTRFPRELLVEGEQARAVLAPDRAYVNGRPVPEHHVGRPVSRIRVLGSALYSLTAVGRHARAS